MTTFAKGRRARTLPLPRHEHIKPVEHSASHDITDEGPIDPEILALAGALARGLARAHHAASLTDTDAGD